MKSRFEPDLSTAMSPDLESLLIDPDGIDVSEQQFSASLQEEQKTKPSARPRFVVEKEDANPEIAGTEGTASSDPETQVAQPEAASAPFELHLEPDPGAWRQEVAARVNKYRARRRSPGPRYPSLKLQFEEPDWNPHPRTEGTLAQKHAAEEIRIAPVEEAFTPVNSAQVSSHWANDTAKIIEFPRSQNAPPAPVDELADPVLERPRILEVPDVAPPPPALGGILIESPEAPAREKRPGFEIPLQPAHMSRRLLASAVDGFVVVSAFALFAYIFVRMTSTVPRPPQLLAASAGLLAVFWVAYQYLLLVRAGTTLGLKLTKLELDCFDGTPAKQSLRRWRVLASVLSGASLGLGYAWCFLDEDQLCWHDRITRTYMAPRTPR